MKLSPVYVLFPMLMTVPGQSQELSISAEEFPRIPHTEPAEAIDTFEVEDGFEIQLTAHEPNVMDPIAMAFDEKGRAYVLEMRGYSERREEALGRVRLLTDTNGDGTFDQSTVFKDGLKWPTAILCYRGGVIVGATPDIHYFRDTDDDGVADEEKHLFTGFGVGKPELNMQALFNSFRWGPDNRVWGATAPNGGSVTRPDAPEFGPVNLRGADFSFDPEALDLRPENGTAQYGMSFDSNGRRFVCSNSRHLIHVAYERHQVLENPLYSLPPALNDIPNDGAAAPVYRISPDEPWRIVRTRWRVAGVVKGIVEGGGRVSGYFTSASGVHLYWGDAFGTDFRDNAFIGDVGSNLVHRKIIETDEGTWSLTGRRPDENEKTEFLRSTDNWFRPTSFATGPDGCLYVTDMYRETIEHPWSLPAPIKKHLDLNSGFDRGRIYRIAPKGFTAPPGMDLSTLSNDELKQFLNAPEPSQWHETTARRLLYERGISLTKDTPEPFPASLGETSSGLSPEKATKGTWKKAAFLNALRTPEALLDAWSEASSSQSPLAAEIAAMIGRSRDRHLIETVAADLATTAPQLWLATVVQDLSAGVRRGVSADHREALAEWGFDDTGISPNDFSELTFWKELDQQCRQLLLGQATEMEKKASILILSAIGSDDSSSLLRSLLADDTTSAALKEVLVSMIDEPTALASSFPTLPPNAKASSAERILSLPEASASILDQISANLLSLDEVPATLIEGLRKSPDKAIQAKAKKILPPVVTRQAVIETFKPAISTPGDRDRGKMIFARICQSCHLDHEGLGIDLGPAINSFATAGRESLLERILDPNREVAPQYEAYVFTMVDGRVYSGMIRSETTDEVTLRLPGGIDQNFPRREVASMEAVGQSLMPTGLENSMTVDEMADLLAYLEAIPEKD